MLLLLFWSLGADRIWVRPSLRDQPALVVVGDGKVCVGSVVCVGDRYMTDLQSNLVVWFIFGYYWVNLGLILGKY